MLIIKIIILKKTKLMKTIEMYETPLVEVIEVEVEKGFANTTGNGVTSEDYGSEEEDF